MGNCVQLPGAQPPLTLLKCCTVWPSAGGREAKQVCHGTTHALAIYKFKLFCRALEAVLGGTDSPKHLPVFCARRHAERLAYALTERPQKWVGRLLFPKQAWHGRATGRALCVNARLACCERLIARVDRNRKTCVGLSVLMRAEDMGVVWQGQQLRQGRPHHLWVALKQPSTAQRKERVTWEECLRGWDVERDVAAGVTRRVKHLHLCRAKRELVSVLDLDVDARDASGIRARPDNGQAMAFLQLQVGTRVVSVVVRVEDVRQLPALCVQSRLHRLRL
mmetsp:Transcript_14587/g.42679  ORF Transcript_14587/g.42679 Transcript_14587/m.42679 type:complete len:278 (-) Transcript_14587:286-1119(-)